MVIFLRKENNDYLLKYFLILKLKINSIQFNANQNNKKYFDKN